MKAAFELAREYKNDTELIKTCGGDATPHFHQHVEIYYVASGETEIKINKETRLLKKNQLSIASCYDIHSYMRKKSGLSFIILIPPDFLGQYMQILKDGRPALNFVTDGIAAKNIFFYIKKLEEALNLGYNKLVVGGILSAILGLIVENTGVTDGRPLNLEFIEEVLKFIEINFKKDLTLEEISSTFGYSKFHFSKLFNSNFSCNINEALNILRARNVTKLIKAGGSLTSAVFDSGFTSMRTFYRVFKRVYGKTFTEYEGKEKL